MVAAPWPQFQEQLAKEEQIEVVIQINGRVRGKMLVEPGLGEEELYGRAVTDPRIAQLIASQRVVKKIVVRDKLVNVVVG